MKTNNKYKIRKGLCGAVILSCFALHGSLFTSCSDTWDDHYPSEQINGTESLLQIMEKNAQLSDFLKVAKATHLYNNMHSTPVTYAELLGSDQALTVWAPQNGTFNVDSLLELCKTSKGDSLVGQQFVGNHIAHNLYNLNSQTQANVKMFNDKFMTVNTNSFSSSSVVSTNTPATNGLLHVIDKSAPFAYNIYEGITCLDEFAHIGQFFTRFEKQELDEDRSIVAGIEDGQKVYSDSVMVRHNILFNTLDNIISEDSSFAMIVPSKEIWDQQIEEAKPYFNFSTYAKGDSIQNYWLNISLIQDLIYNQNMQRSINDSIFTTSYSRFDWPYHVYYKPYAEGGILNPANIKDSIACSNGVFYRLAKWPFKKEDLYFRPITTQAENESNIVNDNNLCTYNYRAAVGDTISGNGYLDIVPKNSSSNWKTTFEIRNTLSGTYDVCAVILPKTVYNSFTRDFKPNQFKATVYYQDENGREQSIKSDNSNKFHNDPYVVDTVKLATVTLPVCAYQQSNAVMKVELECSMTSKETSYSREMFLDCIYLRPSTENENSAKARKEDKK